MTTRLLGGYMFNFSESTMITLIAGLPAIVIAMSVHEFAHAYAADKLGDPTPGMMGRLTLNPIVHVDIIGLVMLFIAQIGWARPVMINPRYFKNPRRDDILVSLAGPFANLITAFLSLFTLYAIDAYTGSIARGTELVFTLITIYNINFAIFNLLPIPPLDGSSIIKNLLPYSWVEQIESLERYSIFLFIILINLPFFRTFFVFLQRIVMGIYLSIMHLIF